MRKDTVKTLRIERGIDSKGNCMKGRKVRFRVRHGKYCMIGIWSKEKSDAISKYYNIPF